MDNHGCRQCAYEVGVPLPEAAGLCVKHADDAENAERSIRLSLIHLRTHLEAADKALDAARTVADKYDVLGGFEKPNDDDTPAPLAFARLDMSSAVHELYEALRAYDDGAVAASRAEGQG